MLLFFAEDEVADEVAGIVRRNQRPLLIALPGDLLFSVALIDYLRVLVHLIALAGCVRTSEEPVGSRFDIVVTAQSSVLVYNRRIGEVVLQIGHAAIVPRILDDETDVPLGAYRHKLEQ